MKTLFIPTLGAELTLAADWTFTLHNEHRNEGLISGLKLKMPLDARGYYDRNASLPCTLAAGTVLTVRRYYIRLGQGAFDSVTFSAKIGKKSHRFWVKLADANRIVMKSDDESVIGYTVADAAMLIDMMDNPKGPNDALKAAFARFKERELTQ